MRCREAQGEGKFEIRQGSLDFSRHVWTTLTGDLTLDGVHLGPKTNEEASTTVSLKLGYVVKLDYKGFKEVSVKEDHNKETRETAQSTAGNLTKLFCGAHPPPTSLMQGK